MKTISLIISCIIFLSIACNHPKETTTISPSFNGDSVATSKTDTTSKTSKPSQLTPKTKGKVSHQFASKGCATVIVVNSENGEEQILIPRAPLEKQFDKEGLEIFFNYHPLKMRQPPGCEKGIPAEITDVSLRQ
jgi:hypothetical protein